MFLAGFALYYVGCLAPYNLQGLWNANRLGIVNEDSLKNINELSEYFKGYTIKKVKYLGSDTYEVFTDRVAFIIVADYSDSAYWKYKILKI